MFSDSSKISMLNLAREAITSNLIEHYPIGEMEFDHKKDKLGVFVTLRKGEELRGCIGTIFTDLPLYELLPDMAIASASRDPRFFPVTIDEMDDIVIEISVLSPFTIIEKNDDIIIGQHGVMLEHLGKRGVFLPEVAENQGWDIPTIIEQLCYKAGLTPDIIKDKPRLQKFETIKISDDNSQRSSY